MSLSNEIVVKRFLPRPHWRESTRDLCVIQNRIGRPLCDGRILGRRNWDNRRGDTASFDNALCKFAPGRRSGIHDVPKSRTYAFFKHLNNSVCNISRRGRGHHLVCNHSQYSLLPSHANHCFDKVASLPCLPRRPQIARQLVEPEHLRR